MSMSNCHICNRLDGTVHKCPADPIDDSAERDYALMLILTWAHRITRDPKDVFDKRFREFLIKHKNQIAEYNNPRWFDSYAWPMARPQAGTRLMARLRGEQQPLFITIGPEAAPAHVQRATTELILSGEQQPLSSPPAPQQHTPTDQ